MRKRAKRVILVGVLGMASLAGCHRGVSTAEVSHLVGSVTHGQATVRRIFEGPPGSGLTGAVIAGGNNPPVVIWIAEDGKTLIAGNVFDARGRNLTEVATIKLADFGAVPSLPLSPSPPPSPPAPVAFSASAFGKMSQSARFIAQGTGKRTLWIFLDPDCIWCHRLYADFKASPLPKDVSVHWIPVAFLKPSSSGKAQALLSGGLPALQQDEDRFDTKNEEGGVREIRNPTLAAEVKKNTEILQTIGGKESPTLVFTSSTGNRRFDGYPTPEVVARILREMR